MARSLRAHRAPDRDRPVRAARRRDRHRADRGRRRAARGRGAPLGPERGARRPGRRACRPPPLRRRRRRRADDRHLGPRHRAARRRRPIASSGRARCTGWTSRATACDWRAPRRQRAGEPTRSRSRSRSTTTSTVPRGQETIRLLARALEDEPPDLILAETLSLVRSTTYATVETLLEIGLPVWLSFRRCRQGVCGVYGEHWGGPEGDAFGRAARRFEEMGVGALMINCVPPDHAAGMVAWLRDFTDLPLGVYPNLATSPMPAGKGTSASRSTRRWRWGGAPRAPRSSAVAAASGRATSRPRRPCSVNEAGRCPPGPRERRRRPDGRPTAPRRRPAGSMRASGRCSRSASPTSRSRRTSSCPTRRASCCGSTCTAKARAPTGAASTSAAARAC